MQQRKPYLHQAGDKRKFSVGIGVKNALRVYFVFDIEQALFRPDGIDQFHPFKALFFANNAALLDLSKNLRFFPDFFFFIANLPELTLEFIKTRARDGARAFGGICRAERQINARGTAQDQSDENRQTDPQPLKIVFCEFHGPISRSI